MPITANEVAWLLSGDGRAAIPELYGRALDSYDTGRVTEQSFLAALQQCVAEGKLGYAVTENEALQPGILITQLEGYIGQPEALPEDTRILQFGGTITSVELASVMKTVSNLSKLGESTIALHLRLELRGESNDHAVTMALNELRSRVPNLKVDELS